MDPQESRACQSSSYSRIVQNESRRASHKPAGALRYRQQVAMVHASSTISGMHPKTQKFTETTNRMRSEEVMGKAAGKLDPQASSQAPAQGQKGEAGESKGQKASSSRNTSRRTSTKSSPQSQGDLEGVDVKSKAKNHSHNGRQPVGTIIQSSSRSARRRRRGRSNNIAYNDYERSNLAFLSNDLPTSSITTSRDEQAAPTPSNTNPLLAITPDPIEPLSIPEPPSTPPPIFINHVLQVPPPEQPSLASENVDNLKQCKQCNLYRRPTEILQLACGHWVCEVCVPVLFWDEFSGRELPIKSCGDVGCE